jgi:hypothetical protein
VPGCVAVDGQARMGWDGMGWGKKDCWGTVLHWDRGSDKETTAVSGGKDRGCELICRMPWVDSYCQTRKRM